LKAAIERSQGSKAGLAIAGWWPKRAGHVRQKAPRAGLLPVPDLEFIDHAHLRMVGKNQSRAVSAYLKASLRSCSREAETVLTAMPKAAYARRT
jgi:hypothetical protein